MIHRVQLALEDAAYAEALREALARNGPWQVVKAEALSPCPDCVAVIDDAGLERFPLPIRCPERIVLVTQRDPDHLDQAWEAGLIAVVSHNDPLSTVVLAIMSAALRVSKDVVTATSTEFSPSLRKTPAPIAPQGHARAGKPQKIN